ncbi:hypothetical protein ACLOJK_023070 [Asimina triloba]
MDTDGEDKSHEKGNEIDFSRPPNGQPKEEPKPQSEPIPLQTTEHLGEEEEIVLHGQRNPTGPVRVGEQMSKSYSTISKRTDVQANHVVRISRKERLEGFNDISIIEGVEGVLGRHKKNEKFCNKREKEGKNGMSWKERKIMMLVIKKERDRITNINDYDIADKKEYDKKTKVIFRLLERNKYHMIKGTGGIEGIANKTLICDKMSKEDHATRKHDLVSLRWALTLCFTLNSVANDEVKKRKFEDSLADNIRGRALWVEDNAKELRRLFEKWKGVMEGGELALKKHEAQPRRNVIDVIGSIRESASTHWVHVLSLGR